MFLNKEALRRFGTSGDAVTAKYEGRELVDPSRVADLNAPHDLSQGPFAAPT